MYLRWKLGHSFCEQNKMQIQQTEQLTAKAVTNLLPAEVLNLIEA